ncbi:MAG: DNA mismatch repair endonuclease MutL [Thermoflavifilum sp.]|nr:DNA mismatch repair endonuclease MutL [Thermoflavifilum sp.]MCL6513461.1 DNA mismatch repair endonuclease MutL [Alicyclobacillus sp.]
MPPELANQIAAGEVVERPASCVKELIENSLDAQASHVHVELQQGGIQAIVVTDDGSGMDAEDAVLAFERHATSKVRHPRDLFRIRTLGFRGEALASIAAVARVELQTRQRGAAAGTRVRVEGSRLQGPAEPTGMPPGTRIEVRDLFFNTPARLKYLRSVQTEQARCMEVVQRAAMARPDVAFRCDVEGRVAFRTGGRGDLLEVLAALWGIPEAEQLLRVDTAHRDYRVTGYVGRPAQAKSSRNFAHLFVNGRPIRNLTLHQAVLTAYGERLMVHRQPIYALHIEMDPALVDVNIHPHKSEVRFSEERDLAELVREAVAAALGGASLIPPAKLAPPSPERVVGGRSVPSPQPPTRVEGSRGVQVSLPLGRSRWSPAVRPVLEAALRTEEHPPDVVREPSPQAEVDAQTEVSGSVSRTREPVLPPLRLVGQVLGTYIVAEAEDALYVLDQHAAHERVLYERFKQRLEEQRVSAVPLLTPLTVRLLPEERQAVQAHRELLEAYGLHVEEFGGADMVIRAVPDIWEGLDALRLAEELLRELPSVGKVADPREPLREWLALRACKAAVKAGMTMSEPELTALLEALSECRDPFHCPHGRPIWIRLTRRELDVQFRRIV